MYHNMVTMFLIHSIAGVPDKPVIKICDDGNMTWNKPINNGQEIIDSQNTY